MVNGESLDDLAAELKEQQTRDAYNREAEKQIDHIVQKVIGSIRANCNANEENFEEKVSEGQHDESSGDNASCTSENMSQYQKMVEEDLLAADYVSYKKESSLNYDCDEV